MILRRSMLTLIAMVVCDTSTGGTTDSATLEAGQMVSFEEYGEFFKDGVFERYLRHFDELSEMTVVESTFNEAEDEFALRSSSFVINAVPSFDQTGKFMKYVPKRDQFDLAQTSDESCIRGKAHITVTCSDGAPSPSVADQYDVYLSSDAEFSVSGDDRKIEDFDAFLTEDYARIGIDYQTKKSASDELRALQTFDIRCVWATTPGIDMVCYSKSPQSSEEFEAEYVKVSSR